MDQQSRLKLVGLVLATLVVVVLGLSAWQLATRSDSPRDSESEQSSSANESSDESIDPRVAPQVPSQSESNGIIDLSVNLLTLQSVQDADKLPDGTPASFKAYIQNVLAGNTVKQSGCLTTYAIQKISDTTIVGSIVDYPTDANDPLANPCDNGNGVALWLFRNETWNVVESGIQNVFLCRELEAYNVQSGLIAQCIDDGGTLRSNPNDS